MTDSGLADDVLITNISIYPVKIEKLRNHDAFSLGEEMQLDSRWDLQEHAIVHRIPQRTLYTKYESSIKNDPRGIGCRREIILVQIRCFDSICPGR